MSGKMPIYLDTHVVVWLYHKTEGLISDRAITMVGENDLLISPMVLLELEYLFETRRIKEKARTIYDYLHETILLETCSKPFARVAGAAATMKWTNCLEQLINSENRHLSVMSCQDKARFSQRIRIIGQNHVRFLYST